MWTRLYRMRVTQPELHPQPQHHIRVFNGTRWQCRAIIWCNLWTCAFVLKLNETSELIVKILSKTAHRSFGQIWNAWCSWCKSDLQQKSTTTKIGTTHKTIPRKKCKMFYDFIPDFISQFHSMRERARSLCATNRRNVRPKTLWQLIVVLQKMQNETEWLDWRNS